MHFTIDSRPVLTPDIEELLADSGQDARSLGENTKFTARVSPDVPIPDRSTVDLVIDTTKLHFFDPETSDKIGATTIASRSEADPATV